VFPGAGAVNTNRITLSDPYCVGIFRYKERQVAHDFGGNAVQEVQSEILDIRIIN